MAYIESYDPDSFEYSFNKLRDVFAAFGSSIQEIVRALGNVTDAVREVGTAWHDLWLVRRPHEHPLDWVQRVGIEVSGHNITEGDAWRYRNLRDWWTPDEVDDQYGMYYPEQPDLWGNG